MNIDKILILSSAVIKNKKNEILLLKRGETKTFQGHFQLPEGKLEENEIPFNALKRELKEELGISIKSADLKVVSETALHAKGVKYLAFRLIYQVKIPATKKIKLSPEHSLYIWIKKNEIGNLKLLPGTKEAIEKADNIKQK